MAALDLVISSDTASAHLAGALGLQAWVVLPFAPDWRWGLGADTTPWYPKLRLFRQPRPGDWDGLFNELRAALLQMILERSTALEEGREAG
jgi:ADP-heptose:LPS heptosyltransferase